MFIEVLGTMLQLSLLFSYWLRQKRKHKNKIGLTQRLIFPRSLSFPLVSSFKLTSKDLLAKS